MTLGLVAAMISCRVSPGFEGWGWDFDAPLMALQASMAPTGAVSKFHERPEGREL